MNFTVLLAGIIITGMIEVNLWLSKCIFVDKIEQNFKEKGRTGTFKIEYLNFSNDDRMGVPMGKIYDDYGNCVTPDYCVSLASAANFHNRKGNSIKIEYYETDDFSKYRVRILGHKEPRSLIIGLMIFFLILGIIITIPVSLK